MRLGFLLLFACSARGTPSVNETPAPPPVDVEMPAPAALRALSIVITEPVDGAIVDAETIHIRGTADGRAEQIFVRVGPNSPLRAMSEDGFRTWSIDVPLGVGMQVITASAEETKSDAVHVTRPSAAADDEAPILEILGPRQPPKYQPTLVSGTTHDDRAVVRMEMTVDGISYGPTDTSDYFAHWFASLALAPGSVHTIIVSAWDAAGHVSTQTLMLDLPSVQDQTPPTLAITAPAETVDADIVTIGGTARDAGGISSVKISMGGIHYIAAYDVATAAFSASVPMPYGDVTFTVKAIDTAGLSTTQTRTVHNQHVREWLDEQVITLRDRSNDPRAALSLSLDEPALKQLIDLQTRKQIKVLDIDPTPLLENALNDIMNACGTAWTADVSSPSYNCNLTPLGQSFPQPWQDSAEYALVRLLTMTPANVDVAGTSIATLADIADFIGLGGGFGQLLALTLGIARTDPVVPRTQVAQALKDKWMGSHPAVNPDKTLPVTLHDVLEDMAPLAQTFGPSGGHPGVLAAAPYAALFGPATKINLQGISNLRWMDGIQLGVGKEYFGRTDRPKLIDLDFYNGFSITAMVSNEPTIDMRFRIFEDPSRINACTGDSCKDNVPGSNARGIWNVSPWKLESVINQAAYLRYNTRDPNPDTVYSWNILVSSASIKVQTTTWSQGWAIIAAQIIGIGLAPPPQYLWELIDEVAQRRLHYPIGGGTIAEGNANVAFTLKQVPTGLNATTIVNGVRAQLRLQEAFLIDRMLGNWQANNGPVDFYYQDGKLIFLPSQEAYVLGAGAHELIRQGQDGATYRIRIQVPAGAKPTITVAVAKRA